MKKYIMLTLFLVLLTGCSLKYDNTKGKINKTETTIYKNNNHKEEEINAAIEEFKNSFKDVFYKCDLLTVEYGIDEVISIEPTLLEREENPTEALALVFKFKTSSDAYKELESSKEYTFYAYMIKVNNKWILLNTGEILI